MVVSAGDNGPAACDDPNSESDIPSDGTSHLGVSGIASTPYNVAMGGTDFDQVGDQTNFWNPCTAGAQLHVRATIRQRATFRKFRGTIHARTPD